MGVSFIACTLVLRRSRKGAWIEMIERSELAVTKLGRSREGAWIEIAVRKSSRRGTLVAPVRERGLKYGTWLDFRFC